MGRQNERTLGPFGKVRYFIIEKENWGVSNFFRPTGQKQTQNRQTKIGMIIRFPLIDIYRWERDERETQTEMETQRTKRETNWKRDKRQRWRRWTEGSVGSWGRHRFWSKSSSQTDRRMVKATTVSSSRLPTIPEKVYIGFIVFSSTVSYAFSS